MKLKIIISLLVFGICSLGFSQLKTYSFEEADKLSAENPKPYFIFIKTDWCKICKMMEKSTFQNQEILSVLNRDFYVVLLDAQSKSDIKWNGKTFKYIPNGINSGIHELAAELATIKGEIAFPTTVILNQNFEIVGQKSGFINSDFLLSILQKVIVNR